MNNEYKNIIRAVPWGAIHTLSRNLIQVNGLHFQISLCIEEISEYLTEIILLDSPKNIADESADVIVTLGHVSVGYDIKKHVTVQRNNFLSAPETTAKGTDRILALLALQKELSKNINRHVSNVPEITSAAGKAYAALFHTILIHNNLSQVKNSINDKINRTIQREFIDKNRQYFK